MHLTPGESKVVKAPIVQEAPISIECKVKEVVPLGSHDMFIAEVVNVQADDRFLDPQTGKFDMEKAGLMVYAHGGYYGLGEKIGKFGWSVEKKKNHSRKSSNQK
jgi:flavin reductase (DIM6/NTAB) family NADH-FMN oxidoreductase RutF